jgi:hypothetical protein
LDNAVYARDTHLSKNAKVAKTTEDLLTVRA